MLGRMRNDLGGEVRIKTADVLLSVDAKALEQAQMHERKVSEERRARELQDIQLDRAEQFRKLVLENSGTAMAYWAMNHPNLIGSETSDHLAKLVEGVMEHERSVEPWFRTASVLLKFAGDLDPAGKKMLLTFLGNALAQYGELDAADELNALASSWDGDFAGRDTRDSQQPGARSSDGLDPAVSS
ncbi:hypothetical protein [Pseudonocardia yunnanensis]|uniref:Uncharacterized protein n=1 Tax=Pseudonocardia yunnanensis TaxID=58107 RepID=A0ABW4ETC7_9PSEU